MGDVDIVAVADPNLERASEFASRWNCGRAYASVTDMLDAEKPDFVDIVTRPETHRELAQIAAERGVHIICQKPLAPTPDEAAAMTAHCSERGVRLIVHENWRWQPWYRALGALIRSGEVGHVFYAGVQMRTGDGRGPEPYEVQPYFREMPRLLIFETLVHFLDTLRFLMGEIETVSCSVRRVNPRIAGEDCVLMQIGFASGAVASVDANRISGPNPPPVAFGHVRVEGDAGYARVAPDGSVFFCRYGEPERVTDFVPPRTGYKGDSVFAFEQHAVECLRTGRRAESEAADYLRTIAAVEACYRSAVTRREERTE